MVQDYKNDRVLVIGFGMSGIVQTHSFVSNGFKNVTVVEAMASCGGVWNTALHYPGMGANNSRITWGFPELKPTNFSDYPRQEEVEAYFQEYVDKFDLAKHVQFGTKATSVSRRKESGKWVFDVTFDKNVKGTTKTTYDQVVVCSGFTSAPKIPTGLQSAPNGVKVMHSSEIRAALANNPNFLQGKRVAVLGHSKSGQDAATWAGETDALSIDLIGPHLWWSFPRYFQEDEEAGLTANAALFSGLMSYLLPCNPASFEDRSGWYGFGLLVLYFLHQTFLGRWLRDLFWDIKMKQLEKIADYPPSLHPKRKVCDGTHMRYFSVQDPKFFPQVHNGRIGVALGRATGFDSNGALLVSDEEGNTTTSKKYDVVICATGWGLSLGFLSDEINDKLYNKIGQVQLFRNLVCPDVPGLCFVGFHKNLTSTLAFPVGAKWVTEYAKGAEGSVHRNGVLDDHNYVQRIIKAGNEFDATGERDPHGYYTTGSPVQHYVDALFKDMGSKYYNRSPFLAAQVPSIYEGLMTE